jgi:hypothetical protein
MIRSRGRLLAPLALSLVLSACALTTHYDATSYQNATNLKAETLLLVEKAKDPPGKHAQAIEQWRLLIDPDAALLGGFLRKWKTENAPQSDAFLKGIARNVGDAFDEIIKVQSAKVKD